MSRIIKLVWEFRGGDALGTAQHHIIHLKNFSKKEMLAFYESDIEIISERFVVAFLKVEEADAQRIYGMVKPDRGEVFKG
tara:strand:- start:529 stop:768 length:240 start_codon:yes stop_codon:yes gene_type:complete